MILYPHSHCTALLCVCVCAAHVEDVSTDTPVWSYYCAHDARCSQSDIVPGVEMVLIGDGRRSSATFISRHLPSNWICSFVAKVAGKNRKHAVSYTVGVCRSERGAAATSSAQLSWVVKASVRMKSRSTFDIYYLHISSATVMPLWSTLLHGCEAFNYLRLKDERTQRHLAAQVVGHDISGGGRQGRWPCSGELGRVTSAGFHTEVTGEPGFVKQ